MCNDPRYRALRRGLLQLTDMQLQRILDEKLMVFDTWNYEEETGRY